MKRKIVRITVRGSSRGRGVATYGEETFFPDRGLVGGKGKV